MHKILIFGTVPSKKIATNSFEASLKGGAINVLAGSGTLPDVPGRFHHLLLVQTLGKAFHCSFELSQGAGLASPHLLHCHSPKPVIQEAEVRRFCWPRDWSEARDDPSLESLVQPGTGLKRILRDLDQAEE